MTGDFPNSRGARLGKTPMATILRLTKKCTRLSLRESPFERRDIVTQSVRAASSELKSSLTRRVSIVHFVMDRNPKRQRGHRIPFGGSPC